ncbi:MAG: AraC family transcriptional regulator [Lachnospiraceae bacterium]|nr:AraC family transcriptional regulator [Lachnospiraceae bacterium]
MESLLFFPLDSPYSAAYRCNAPDDPVGPHSHNGAELYLTLTPLPDVLIEDHLFEVSENTLIIIPPFCVHQLYHERDVCYERYVLNITDSWLRNIFGADTIIPSALLNKGTPIIIDLKKDSSPDDPLKTSRKMISLFRELSSRGNSLSPESLVILFEMIAEITRLAGQTAARPSSLPVTGPQKKVNEIISYIQDNIEKDISVKELADHYHLHPDYLSRLFRQHAHMPPGRYIDLQRNARAQEMLRQGMSVSEVSDKMGFSSYAYFFRSFQKIAGISPAKYRTQYAHTDA